MIPNAMHLIKSNSTFNGFCGSENCFKVENPSISGGFFGQAELIPLHFEKYFVVKV